MNHPNEQVMKELIAYTRMKIAVLASHGGSNLQALIDASKNGSIPASIDLVMSNNRKAFALERARGNGIPIVVINGITHPDEKDRDTAMDDALQKHQVDLVVLAGFMKKLGPKVLLRYQGRILNIHPALLPRHGGQGMYGMKVHEAVIESGDRQTGATVHLVDENYDTGEIVLQKAIDVRFDDTVDSLGSRVLDLEHELIIEAVQTLSEKFAALPGGGADSLPLRSPK